MADMVCSQPHHDGSALYVPDPYPRLGGRVTVLFRVPRPSDVTNAWVRLLFGAVRKSLPSLVMWASLLALADKFIQSFWKRWQKRADLLGWRLSIPNGRHQSALVTVLRR